MTLRQRLLDVDLRLFHEVADRPTPTLDRVLPPLSQSANHSVLWFAIAAAYGLAGGRRGRRAALRGVGSIAVASALTNIPAKLVSRRVRPDLARVPLARRVRRQPWTTSFPSGHSAAAAAFATGVALESPALGLPVVALAATVAYSRVHVGVHYPSDVLAGVAIGTSAALLTRRSWPVRKEGPAETAPAAAPDVVRLPDGQGVSIVVNLGGGSADDSVAAHLRAELPNAEVIEVDEPDRLEAILADAAQRAVVLGVAGGDGTLCAGAAAAAAAGKPMLALPAGTLNHFARDLGLFSVDDALTALRDGTAGWVDVGEIDGRPFLNTASWGSYTALVDAREKLEDRIGKWPAVIVALVSVLRRDQPVEVVLDGRPRRLWMGFAGNCRYRPDGFAPSWRERLDDGRLDVRLIDAHSPLARTRLVLAVLSGRLGRCRVYSETTARELRVETSAPIRLSRDGETFDASGRSFTVTKSASRLAVYRAAPTG